MLELPDAKVPKYTNWRIINFRRLEERKRKQTRLGKCERFKLAYLTLHGFRASKTVALNAVNATVSTSLLECCYVWRKKVIST